MKAGEIVELKVESLTVEGDGLGTLGDRTVHCRGVFPAERAQVRIEAVSRHHPRAHARLVRLEQPHPDRRRAPCLDHESRLGRCAGCGLMELDEGAQREAKRALLRDRFGLEVPWVEAAPQQLGYRHSSKRVVLSDRRSGGPFLGSYAAGSHEPASMANCLVDHPALMRAFAAVERALRALAIRAYDEQTGEGDLRYVWAKTNGQQVILTLVSAAEESRVYELAALLADQVAGILHSVQPARGNSLRGSAARVLHGQREVAISLLGQPAELGALGFVQPNPVVAEQAYRELTDGEPGALAFDLYAGAGITTHVLRERFTRVIPCEANLESAQRLGVEASTVEAFLQQDHGAPELVIANPPRKGLGPEVCAALSRLHAPALHVMSCGPEALARDLSALSARYELVSLRAFDTLPQTPHIELVARLRQLR